MRLRTFFLQYLLILSGGTIVLLILLLGLFTAAFSANVILPANYAEKEIDAVKDTLAAGKAVTPAAMPTLADYAVFTAEGKLLTGSLNGKGAARARELIQQGKNQGSYYYSSALNGEELWIFRYTLKPQFASPLLRSCLPNPQLLGVLLFILSVLVLAATLAARFGRRLTQKMAGLQEATDNIRQENLEFTVQPSGIREIDEMLASLEQMKEALQASLKRQWELERSRREQISALAHDIKTPVTIIRGNAELLQETRQDHVQQEYSRYILQSVGDIEAFVQEVIDLSSLQAAPRHRKGPVCLTSFLGELESQLQALSSGKDISAQVTIGDTLPEIIVIDKELLQRGIVNILANAVEHTPPQGLVALEIRLDQAAAVSFIITDTGSGFSPAGLREAATQFYMGDLSRSSGKHHGMGLYIAESAAQQHGGTLTLENAAPSGGGRVTVRITPDSRMDSN